MPACLLYLLELRRKIKKNQTSFLDTRKNFEFLMFNVIQCSDEKAIYRSQKFFAKNLPPNQCFNYLTIVHQPKI